MVSFEVIPANRLGLGAIDNSKPLLAVIIERLLGGSFPAKTATEAADAPAVPAPVQETKTSAPLITSQPKIQADKPDPVPSKTPGDRTPKGLEKPALELAKPVPEGQTAAEKKRDDFDYANWKPRDRSALEGPSKEKDLFGGANPGNPLAKDKQETGANKAQANPFGGTGMKQTEPLKKDTQAELPKKSTGNLMDDKPKAGNFSDRDMKRNKLEPSSHGAGYHEHDLDEPEIGGYPDGTEEHLADMIEGQEEDDPNVHLVLTQGMQIGTSDDMYISESYGYNFSVTSEAMKQFDHIEEVEPVDDDDY